MKSWAAAALAASSTSASVTPSYTQRQRNAGQVIQKPVRNKLLLRRCLQSISQSTDIWVVRKVATKEEEESHNYLPIGDVVSYGSREKSCRLLHNTNLQKNVG